MDVVHEDLPPEVYKVGNWFQVSGFRFHSPGSSVVVEVPWFHRADEMCHFGRLAKPFVHTHATVSVAITSFARVVISAGDDQKVPVFNVTKIKD